MPCKEADIMKSKLKKFFENLVVKVRWGIRSYKCNFHGHAYFYDDFLEKDRCGFCHRILD